MMNNLKYYIVRLALAVTYIMQRILHKVSLQRFPPFCSSLALIENDSKFLVVYHRIYKQYTFPGGYVRLHENPAIAVRRELKEETGLDIRPVRIIGAYENKQGVRSINIVYECNATVGELLCNYEGKCEWLPENVFAERLISHCQEALRDYKENKHAACAT